MRNKTLFIVLSVCLLITSLATAQKTANLRQQKTALKERVHSFLASKGMKETETLYQMTSPRYRKTVTLEKFKKSRVLRSWNLISYFIEGVDIQGDKGTVYLIEYAMSSGVPAPRVNAKGQQKWVLVENVWYLDADPAAEERLPTNCGNVPLKKAPTPEPEGGFKPPVKRRTTTGCGS